MAQAATSVSMKLASEDVGGTTDDDSMDYTWPKELGVSIASYICIISDLEY